MCSCGETVSPAGNKEQVFVLKMGESRRNSHFSRMTLLAEQTERIREGGEVQAK